MYGDANGFIQQFSPQSLGKYMKYGRDKMIVATNPPTLTIARESFGDTAVKLFLKTQIVSLADYYGVEGSNVDGIANVVAYKAGDLKATELMLFFEMMKEGYFGEDGKMFGRLDGNVISTCLYRFRHEYRVRVIDEHEAEQRKKQREEDEMRQASYNERRLIFAEKCLQDPSFLDIVKQNQWLMENDIKTIESAVEELKMLRLLRMRVESFIKGECDSSTLTKAISYLNEKFPREQ